MCQHEFFLFSANYNTLHISLNTGSSDTCFFADPFFRYKNKFIHSEHFSGTLAALILCALWIIYLQRKVQCA